MLSYEANVIRCLQIGAHICDAHSECWEVKLLYPMIQINNPNSGYRFAQIDMHFLLTPRSRWQQAEQPW